MALIAADFTPPSSPAKVAGFTRSGPKRRRTLLIRPSKRRKGTHLRHHLRPPREGRRYVGIDPNQVAVASTMSDGFWFDS
jgi:hypothetical protein